MKKQRIETIKSFQQKVNANKNLIQKSQLCKIKGGGMDNDCDGTVDE